MVRVDKFMSRFVCSLVCVGFGLVPACAVDDNVGPEPIAQVSLDNGLRVWFYESAPGSIGIAQLVPAGVAKLRDDQRAVEMYAALVPDHPAPPALVAAQARSDAARAARGPEQARTPPAAVGAPTAQSFVFIDNNKIDDRWFVDSQCGADPDDGYPDALVCRPNLTTEIGSSWLDTDTVRYAVCADVGDISFRITSEIPHFWDIFEGHCLFWIQGPGDNFVARARTENVGGSNRYHYSARYWD